MQGKVDVKPAEVIAHDDPKALCTKEGWKKWKEIQKIAIQTLNMGCTKLSVLDVYGPYRYEDNRESGRYRRGDL